MEDWQNKIHCLPLRAKFAVDHKILTDCEFTFGEKDKLCCHKLILAMTSPVFHAMFFGALQHNGSHSIEITDIEAHVFKQMIQYIYTGQTNLSNCKNACDLYHSGKKYILLHLEKQCIDYLLEHVNKENVIQLYEFSQFHGEEELSRRALKEIQCHATSILSDESFIQASDSTVAAVLDLERLNISSECELLVGLERWAQAQMSKECATENTTKDILRPLVKKLRLLTVTKEEFVSRVASTFLLSDNEKLALLLRIIGSDMPPMMNGLCEKKCKRKPRKEVLKISLEFDEVSNARCDGSEWFTSIFETNSCITLLGIEINLQKSDVDDTYKENLMVKVGPAHREDHFAEGSLLGRVSYNSKERVMFQNPPVLEPSVQYSIHVFLCSPGIYPLGYHTKLDCTNTICGLNFVSHTSWEQCHPWNTTVLSSLIFTDVVEN